jgi:Ca2+-binding EF-hand superfamily protein
MPGHSEDAPARTPQQIDADLLLQMRNQALESFIAKLLAPIRNARQPDRLTREEVEAAAATERAKQRAHLVSELLAFDINGDGVVTAQEAEAVPVARVGSRPRQDQWRADVKARNLERLFEADANRDGQLDIAEMLAWAGRQSPQGDDRMALQRLILELDADSDGVTTVHEAEARARQLFARYDRDGDGLIDPDSQPEFSQVERARKSEAKLQRTAERCGAPPAPQDAKIVLFSTHRAQAVSSAAVDGPMEATMTAGVTIETGTEKLYLMLSTDRNMIWRIDGAVHRLTNVVLLEGKTDPFKSSAAATGVDRSIVFWGDRENCAMVRGTTAVPQTNARFTALHGRPPDVFEQVDVLASVSVPSMEFVGVRQEGAVPVRRTACRTALQRGGTVFRPEPAEGADAAPCDWLRAEMELELPGGVIEIDPASVVGRRPAVAYQVLPSPFGFRRALDDGVLTDLSGGSNTRFRIEKPLPYFPPSTGRSRALTFNLAEGIEMPRGATQRYCVFDSRGKQLPTETFVKCPPS